jgi:hypothetical protein
MTGLSRLDLPIEGGGILFEFARVAVAELEFGILHRYARVRRHALGEEDVAGDDGTLADDGFAAKDGSIRIDGDFVLEGWMAAYALKRLAAAGREGPEGDALIELDVLMIGKSIFSDAGRTFRGLGGWGMGEIWGTSDRPLTTTSRFLDPIGTLANAAPRFHCIPRTALGRPQAQYTPWLGSSPRKPSSLNPTIQAFRLGPRGADAPENPGPGPAPRNSGPPTGVDTCGLRGRLNLGAFIRGGCACGFALGNRSEIVIRSDSGLTSRIDMID